MGLSKPYTSWKSTVWCCGSCSYWSTAALWCAMILCKLRSITVVRPPLSKMSHELAFILVAVTHHALLYLWLCLFSDHLPVLPGDQLILAPDLRLQLPDTSLQVTLHITCGWVIVIVNVGHKLRQGGDYSFVWPPSPLPRLAIWINHQLSPQIFIFGCHLTL